MQRVHPKSYVEFWTGGSIDRNGDAFTDASTQALFAESNDPPVVVILFRGTELKQASDLAADLAIWRLPLAKSGWPADWGSAHAGFLQAFEEVEPLLMLKLRELDGTNTPIWITGHSLGAALATLTAARILRAETEGLHVNLRGVYTFGSPRVGDATFARAFRDATKKYGVSSLRFRNANDVVTSIPDSLIGFEHVGLLAYLDDDALVLHPDADLAYDAPSFSDHSSSGFGPGGEAVSGYYRCLAEALKSGKYPELMSCPDVR